MSVSVSCMSLLGSMYMDMICICECPSCARTIHRFGDEYSEIPRMGPMLGFVIMQLLTFLSGEGN